ELVRLVRRVAAGQVRRHEHMDAFVGETGRREHREEVHDVAGPAAGFFTQLAFGADFWILPRVQTARGHLVQILLCGVPILPYEKKLRVVAGRVAQERHDRARARMTYHLELTGAAVGKAHTIDVEIDNPTC